MHMRRACKSFLNIPATYSDFSSEKALVDRLMHSRAASAAVQSSKPDKMFYPVLHVQRAFLHTSDIFQTRLFHSSYADDSFYSVFQVYHSTVTEMQL